MKGRCYWRTFRVLTSFIPEYVGRGRPLILAIFRYPRVGMVVSTPLRMPAGQRAVIVFRRV